MRHYGHNAKWLLWFAPFRALSISAAYLTPFFVEHGLSTSQIFLLQSIFSAAYLLWEIPSGVIADKLGRALSIKVSAPIAALAMIAYGFSDQFWQFVVCELILAIANGLISGVDTALLVDSLKAEKREDQYVKIAQRMDGLGFGAVAAAVPLALVLVHFFGIRSTLFADGIMTLIGLIFVVRLVEAPRSPLNSDQRQRSVWLAMRNLVRNREARGLIALKSSLATATYVAYWLSAIYYRQLGIPVALFGVLLAIRSLWKAFLSHRFHRQRRLKRNMSIYAGLVGVVYIAMASGQLWLVWVVLGHDVVQALGNSPIMNRLNDHFDTDHRAAMNSAANLVQRLAYMIAGPLAGFVVDQAGLQVGLVMLGVGSSVAAYMTLWRLRRQPVFA